MYLTIHEVFVTKVLKGIQIINDGKSPTSYVLVANGNTLFENEVHQS